MTEDLLSIFPPEESALELMGITPQEILTKARKKLKQRRAENRAGEETYQEHQLPPPGDWQTWVMKGGRFAGKTWVGQKFVIDHLREFGKRARVGICAPTIGDVRDTCLEGESGLITKHKGEFRYNRSLLEAWHVDGGYIKGMGTEEPERWRGPQWSLVWVDELCVIKEEAWELLQFGVRLGEHPRIVATTTPKPKKWLRKLYQEPWVVVTVSASDMNQFVVSGVKQRLHSKYDGTRLGRQELFAEEVDDAEGALVKGEWIDNHRVEKAPDLQRIAVGLDPSTTSGPKSHEAGIAVAGIDADGHIYILHSSGHRVTPDAWAKEAVRIFDLFEANRIIAERNQGGEMVEGTLRHVRQGLPVDTIHAFRGKQRRFEPVAMLYEQGRIHHVGQFPELEEQLCTCEFQDANEENDRLDALAYAVLALTNNVGMKITLI